VYIE